MTSVSAPAMTGAPPRRSAASTTAIGVLLLLGYLVAVNVAATQYLARRFAYQPALGARLVGRLYAPWAWIVWLWHYGKLAPRPFYATEFAVGAAFAVGVLVCVLVVGYRARGLRRNEGVHGTAHWATEAEIRATGLLPAPGKAGAGVYVGGWTDAQGRLHYLRHDGPEHIIGIAPTRTGKGVGLVVPTLLSWPHSAVVYDQKAELWALTAGWRQKEGGNRVINFNPTAAEGGVAFNPLGEIRIGTSYEVGDTQNVVTILVDPDGKGLVDHWAKTSHAFLTGAIIHLGRLAQRAGREVSLPEIARAMSDPARPVQQLYQEMLQYEHLGPGQVHPVVAATARDMLNRPDDERGSVLSTAMSYLSLYRDPMVEQNVSRSDFRIDDLLNGPTPVTLYLTSRAEDKDRLKPLMRLVLNQLVRVPLRPELTFKDGRQLPPHKHRMLIMADEFASLGKLEVFQEALSYIAGYGLKAYLIVQDMSQLLTSYGHDESITSNCHVRVAYAPNKVDTAKWLSELSGTATVVKEDITESGQRFGASLQHVSRSYHEVSRPLLTPDEASRLRAPQKGAAGEIIAPGDVLVFVSGHAPIYGTQSLFFENPVFRKRAAIQAPASDRLRPASGAAAAASSTAAAGSARTPSVPVQAPRNGQTAAPPTPKPTAPPKPGAPTAAAPQGGGPVVAPFHLVTRVNGEIADVAAAVANAEAREEERQREARITALMRADELAEAERRVREIRARQAREQVREADAGVGEALVPRAELSAEEDAAAARDAAARRAARPASLDGPRNAEREAALAARTAATTGATTSRPSTRP